MKLDDSLALHQLDLGPGLVEEVAPANRGREIQDAPPLKVEEDAFGHLPAV
jgi:hypothetical protein